MAGGYTHSDAESETAQIHNENSVHAVLELLSRQRTRPTAFYCHECGEEIPDARRKAVPGTQQCVECASINPERPCHVRMLDRIL